MMGPLATKPEMEPEVQEAPEAQAAPQSAASPQDQELFSLLLSRVFEALSKNPQELMSSMQADPIEGAVGFGVQALRTVVAAAEKATGSQIPAPVLMAVGVALMKKLASIAVEKGLIGDDELETFAKETAQQGMMEYLRQDMEEGKITPEQMKQVMAKMGGGQKMAGVLGGA